MTDRRIQYMDLDKIEGAPLNPKGHAEQDLAVSLERWGFTEAPLLDERTGRLVVGHGRIDALRARRDRGEAAPDGVRVTKAGRWQVPAQRGWASKDDQEAFAYLVAGNQLTTAGGWTDDLGPALDQLAAEGTSLDGLGFSADDLDQLLPSRQPVLPSVVDEIGEPPADPITRRGDVWEVGPHRLMCGSAADPAAYVELLSGRLASMVWTDPPYGVSYEGKTAAKLTIENDGREGLEALLRASLNAAASACQPGAVWFVTGPPGPNSRAFIDVLDDLGVLRQTLVWEKDRFVLGRADYHYRHEPIYFGWVPGGPHRPVGDRIQDSIWEVDRPSSSTDHPTMKPVALITRAIRNHSAPGDLVLDPFTGSGSTLVAADCERRVGYGLELSPGYCDVALARLQRHTGITPTRGGIAHDFTPITAA